MTLTAILHVSLQLITLGMLLGAARKLLNSSSITRHTTADSARFWALGSTSLSALLIAGQLATPDSVKTLSALQYLAAVSWLAPLIAVLGARRPGHKAWPWFVILPMILVLQWPSLSQLWAGIGNTPVEVPSPTAIGFCLVLLMGAGNYFGTSNTVSMMTGVVGILMLQIPVTEWLAYDSAWVGPTGLLLISISIQLTHFAEVRASQELPERVHALWFRIRDVFGIVWAKRIADRMNQLLSRESIDARLTLDGFITVESSTAKSSQATGETATQIDSQLDAQSGAGRVPDAVVLKQAVPLLCWILRRFVDPEYLQQFLPQEFTANAFRTNDTDG